MLFIWVSLRHIEIHKRVERGVKRKTIGNSNGNITYIIAAILRTEHNYNDLCLHISSLYKYGSRQVRRDLGQRGPKGMLAEPRALPCQRKRTDSAGLGYTDSPK